MMFKSDVKPKYTNKTNIPTGVVHLVHAEVQLSVREDLADVTEEAVHEGVGRVECGVEDLVGAVARIVRGARPALPPARGQQI